MAKGNHEREKFRNWMGDQAKEKRAEWAAWARGNKHVIAALLKEAAKFAEEEDFSASKSATGRAFQALQDLDRWWMFMGTKGNVVLK